MARKNKPPFSKPPWPKAYAYALITAAMFLFSWAGQFVSQYFVVRNEARDHGSDFAWGDFTPRFFAATFENWQSEFLQLVWQVAGLALFYFWGSSQSRESDERIEHKIDELLKKQGIDPKKMG